MIFYSAKREFEKQFNFTKEKIKNEDKEKELENYAVLFGLIQALSYLIYFLFVEFLIVFSLLLIVNF